MSIMTRAYSLLDVKSFDEELRVIEGIATTPSTDRMGDIVESTGAQFKLPMPLLWQHRAGEPVGHVEVAHVSKTGIAFKARLAKIDEIGELKNLVDKAWQAVKAKLVRGVSIGFRPLEMEAIEDSDDPWATRFKRWEWLELSLVTIPANADASIQVIRSIDAEVLAAIGKRHDGTDGPAARAKAKAIVRNKGAVMAKQTIAEQISAFENTRAAKAARMTEIMEVAAEAGVTLDEAQQEEYDGLETDVKAVDGHLVRLRKLEETNRAAAKPANGGSEKAGSESRGGSGAVEVGRGSVISVKRNVPIGIPFTRFAIAIARAKGNLMQAAEIAKNPAWQDTPEVEFCLKSAVAAGTTTDPAWAGPLVQYQQMASEFIEYLRPLTIIGRIPNLRRVPFNISMPSQTAGSSAQWVGEQQSKPVSRLSFTTVNLRFTKVANIVVLTDELVRFSNPAAEAIVRDDMARGMTEFLDEQFVNPTVAAVANVSPASITNGAPTSVASGTTADDLRTDLKTVLASFSSANIPASGLVGIMESNQAVSIGMMMNALGQAEFPDVNGDGGRLAGYEIIPSDSVRGGDVIWLRPSEILLADDGNVTIDVSREASLQLDTAPSEPPTSMVSLWQQNMVGLRAERYINWLRRRTQAVYVLTGADYGTVASI